MATHVTVSLDSLFKLALNQRSHAAIKGPVSITLESLQALIHNQNVGTSVSIAIEGTGAEAPKAKPRKRTPVDPNKPKVAKVKKPKASKHEYLKIPISDGPMGLSSTKWVPINRH